MGNLLLGAKYYRYTEDDNLEILRVYKHNDTEVKLFDENNKETKIKMTIEDLQKKYIKLNPHAVINFCIAKVGNDLDDVIVTVHKMTDLMSNEPTPYCVCRQNVTDIFANQIRQSDDKLYVGCCMSLDTCPPDVDYRIMIACNEIKKTISLCTYMDDTLDIIMDLVKTKDYDITLNALFVDHVKYVCSTNPSMGSSIIRDRMMKLDSYDGYCKTLRLLLEQNNFMYDFYQTFGIIPVDKKVNYTEEGVLFEDITEIIEDIYNINITSTLCMEYWYDINLEDINNDYVLIIDSENKLYVVGYVSSGQKHVNIEYVESEENIEKMANSTIGTNKSVQEAAQHIRINKNKYN